MLAAPSRSLDLPLKILVAEDLQGKVWISYNSSKYLKERHGLPQNLLPNIAVVETLATAAGEEQCLVAQAASSSKVEERHKVIEQGRPCGPCREPRCYPGNGSHCF